MPRHDSTPLPTADQVEQAAVAEAEILELMKRQIGEGMDWRIVASATSRALADLVGSIAGPGEVPAHFSRMAQLTAPLAALKRH